MRRYHLLQSVVLLVGILSFVSAQTIGAPAVRQEQSEEPIFAVTDYGPPWITGDTGGNGRTDYALKLDEYGNKVAEAVDYNADGFMDDFYHYRNGSLVRQELDTNFDQRIDLWIFMENGVYVRGYHRDTNFDGTIDVRREFGRR